jgi:zinc protease
MNKDLKSISLENGLSVVLFKLSRAPKIAINLFYSVGSKDENDYCRGISHMIEHMIFKGTNKLDEGVIDHIIYSISGYANAFTSLDYTGYSFEVPSKNYIPVLKIIKDTMYNASFKEEYLNSELKAVFHELKMYKDDVSWAMIDETMKNKFHDHPYRCPIIGYKNNIANFKSEQLKYFYKKFYKPEKALLVVAGDLEFEEFEKNLEKIFKTKIKNKNENFYNLRKELLFHEKDTKNEDVVLYRDIKITHIMLSWELPGLNAENSFIYEIISYLIAIGKGSVLYKKLVYDMNLATDVNSFVYDCFDRSILFVYIQPKNFFDIEKIKLIIEAEFEHLKNKISEYQFTRAYLKAKMSYVNVFEDFSKLAYAIGRITMATSDYSAIYKVINDNKDYLIEKTKSIMGEFLSPLFRSCVVASPMDEAQRNVWIKLQIERDNSDNLLLSKVGDRGNVENISDKNIPFKISKKKEKNFKFPDFEKTVLRNGLTVYTIKIDFVEKIDICVDFKAKHYFDEKKFEGRLALLFDFMEEGTKNYPGNSFSEELEYNGIDLETSIGSVSLTCLPEVFERAFNFLQEYLLFPNFDEKEYPRILNQHLVDIESFWDDASCIAKQKIREAVYGDHNYGRNPSGIKESVEKITVDDIKNAYKKFITPHETVIIICSPFESEKSVEFCRKYFENWNGENVDTELKDNPKSIKKFDESFKLNRDQSVICFGGLSVKRFDEDYDKILLYDQFFSGGVSSSMRSKLFSLREQTGMFYSIGGSIVAGASEHEGMIYFVATTSPENIDNAKNMIFNCIDSSFDNFSEEDLDNAKRIIINSFSDLISTNRNLLSTILFMHRFKLNKKYFEDRVKKIKKIKREDVILSVRKILNSDKIGTFTVGR